MRILTPTKHPVNQNFTMLKEACIEKITALSLEIDRQEAKFWEYVQKEREYFKHANAKTNSD